MKIFEIKTLCAVWATSLIAFSIPVCAQTPGNLDPNFDSDGVLILNPGGNSQVATTLAVIPGSGQLMIAGTTDQTPTWQSATARINSDGTIDAGYANGGFTDDTPMLAPQMAYLSSGLTVLSGYIVCSASGWKNTLKGYLANGADSPSFGGCFALGSGGSDRLFGMDVNTNGDIAVAGFNEDGSVQSFATAVYLSSGIPKESFSVDGFVLSDASTDAKRANAVAWQADGKLVIGGYKVVGNGPRFTLLRYDANGNLDFSFGNNAMVVTDLEGNSEQIRALAIQQDGKIIAAGSSTSASGLRGAIARYNSNGTLDQSFGTNGVATSLFGAASDMQINGITLQADGKIVVVGTGLSSSGNSVMIVARLLSNGNLDVAFGSNGSRLVNALGYEATAGNAVEIQNDGNIVAVGSAADASGNFRWCVARLFSGPLASSVEETMSAQMRVFPNPAQDAFKLDLSGMELDSDAELRIMDFLGKEVHRSPAVSGVMTFQVTDLSAGIYHLVLENNGRIGRTKLLVQ